MKFFRAIVALLACTATIADDITGKDLYEVSIDDYEVTLTGGCDEPFPSKKEVQKILDEAIEQYGEWMEETHGNDDMGDNRMSSIELAKIEKGDCVDGQVSRKIALIASTVGLNCDMDPEGSTKKAISSIRVWSDSMEDRRQLTNYKYSASKPKSSFGGFAPVNIAAARQVVDNFQRSAPTPQPQPQSQPQSRPQTGSNLSTGIATVKSKVSGGGVSASLDSAFASASRAATVRVNSDIRVTQIKRVRVKNRNRKQQGGRNSPAKKNNRNAKNDREQKRLRDTLRQEKKKADRAREALKRANQKEARDQRHARKRAMQKADKEARRRNKKKHYY